MIEALVGKKVLVTADGILYTGILVEVSETSVELQGDGGWISIPMEKVSSVLESFPDR